MQEIFYVFRPKPKVLACQLDIVGRLRWCPIDQTTYIVPSTVFYKLNTTYSSFELDVVLCSVSIIPLQHRGCSICMSFVRLGHQNGYYKWRLYL